VALDEPAERPLPYRRGRQLGAEVAQDVVGHADIGAEDVEHRVVADAPVVDLDTGDPDAFLVDLGCGSRVAARHDSADVHVMRHDAHERHQPLSDEDRPQDVDVWQVDAAPAVRIVQDEDVARVDPAAVQAGHGRHGRWERPEVERNAQPLGEHRAVGRAERRRVIERVSHGR
jgi:hypothetical protein